jgi:alanyl-tRNA synthetase
MSGKTVHLFEADSHAREFEAVVVETTALPEGQGVVLDRTLFYPEGGGQPSDRGALNGHAVTDVTEREGAVVHFVEGASFHPGEAVKGVLDWDRRFDHMQQHSGQHLLSQAFVRVLNADTFSFHLGSGGDSTIDIACGELSDTDAARVEAEANLIVFEDRSVSAVLRSVGDLDGVPLRKKPDLEGEVRLVEIKGDDWSLCCGTHVRRTGEIGLVKILRWEKYKSGTRVHFACGGRALREFQAKSGLLRAASRVMTAAEAEVPSVLEKWRDERKASEKRIQALLDMVLEAEADRLMRDAAKVGRLRFVSASFTDRDVQEVQALGRKLVQNPSVVSALAVVRDKATLFFGRSADLELDVRVLLKAASEVLIGKGGGNAVWAQCSSDRTDLVGAAMAKAEEELRRMA